MNARLSNSILRKYFDTKTETFKQNFYKIQFFDIKHIGKASLFFFMKKKIGCLKILGCAA